MPSEHAKLSPSGFSRWSVCPGSIKLSEGIPDRTSSAAQWGTDAHALLEDFLREWSEFKDPDLTLRQVEDYQAKKEVALVAYRYVLEEYKKAVKAGSNPHVYIEKKVHTSHPDVWGSADIILSTDTCLEIIDLKGGDGVLVSPESGQLKIYAVAAAKLCPAAQWVKMTIVQPRIEHKDGPIRSDMMKRDELDIWERDVLNPAIKAALDPNAPLVPGESQCRWCKAQAVCPALAKQNQEMALSCFDDVAAKDLDNLPQVDIKALTPSKIAEIIDAAPMIRSWLKAVEDHALEMLRSGESVPGHKAIWSGGRNGWNRNDEAVIEYLTENGIDRKLITRESVLTAPQALKLKGLDPDQRAIVQSLVVKSQGSLKIVHEEHDSPDAFAELFQDVSFLG